jgi:hypothetical protein
VNSFAKTSASAQAVSRERRSRTASAVALRIATRTGPVTGAIVCSRAWRSGSATRPRTVASAAIRLDLGS